MSRVSVIVPTYNERGHIADLIDQVMRELQGYDFEFVVVDDSSPDGTGDVVRELMGRYSNLRLLVRTEDRGLVQSIRHGLENAKGEFCIWMDADLTMSPALLPTFISHLEGGADLVMGSRYIPGGGMKGTDLSGEKTSFFQVIRNLSMSEDSILAALLSSYGNKAMRYILSPELHDYTSGYFGGKRETFKKVPVQGTFVDYCVSLPYRALLEGMTVVEVPMILNTRKHGESKTSMTFRSILVTGYQCYREAFRLRFTTEDKRGRTERKPLLSTAPGTAATPRE